MKKNAVPSYLLHKQSGRGRAVWTDATGVRREKLLPGAFESSESRAEYAKLILELAVSPVVPQKPGYVLSVAEMLVGFYRHADGYYVDADGVPTKEIVALKSSTKPLRELYGLTPAAEFGPLKLRAVREKMIQDGLSRALINRRVDRVKRVFKWATAEQLIPPGVYESLRALAGLRRGRCEAHETDPVRPVDDAVVDKTLPHLPPHVRVIIQLMRFTGMRPSEVCNLTLAQIDRTVATWTYKLKRHKTAHHGRDRVIQFGPQARAVLLEYLQGQSLNPDELLFSPARQREERFAKMRSERKSKVQPSQASRKKPKPAIAPKAKYTPQVICRAVARAAKKADAPHWHPYQLRHSHGTKARRAFGLEGSQVALGHARADITETYAERDAALAAKVAEQIG